MRIEREEASLKEYVTVYKKKTDRKSFGLYYLKCVGIDKDLKV
jgi:hypothetical protein